MTKSTKTTDQLLKILQNSNDINSYLTNNDSNISNISFHEYLTQLLDEKGLTKAQVITDSNIQKNYGYQIFDGSKTPSRDKVIALALAMQLNLDEANRLLHLSNNGILYPKIKRDSIIIFGLENNQKIIDLNITLDDLGGSTIGVNSKRSRWFSTGPFNEIK